MVYLVAALLSIAVSTQILFLNEKSAITIKCFKIKYNKAALKNLLIVALSALPVFLISALRYGIGTDYFYTYVPVFLKIANGGERSYYEIGFWILNRVIAYFTSNPQWLFVVTSLWFVGVSYYGMYRISKNVQASIVIFFLSYTFFVSLNNVRQSFATAFLFIALIHLLNGKIKNYVLWVIVAGLMHQVAFIFLIYLLVYKIRPSANTMMIGSVVFMLFGKKFAPILLNLAMKIPRLALYFKLSELQRYMQSSISSLMILVNFMILFMICFIEYEYKKELINNHEWNIIKWTQTIFLCACAFDGIIPAMYRIVRIFSFQQFLLIPNAVEMCKDKKQKPLMYLCVFGVYFLIFMQLFLSGSEEVFPYASIIFDRDTNL